MRKLLTLLFLLCSLNAVANLEKTSRKSNNPRDFFVLTLPKSGTHLITKLLIMLTDKKVSNISDLYEDAIFFPPFLNVSYKSIEDYFSKWKLENKFPIAHFNFSNHFQSFYNSHPQYLPIIHVRDLRDVCVSIFDEWVNDLQIEIGNAKNAEKLMHIINGGGEKLKNTTFNMYANIISSLEWLNNPNVIITRFEDLVGPEGGGSIEKQKEAIVKIANALSIPLTTQRLNYLATHLWGIKNGTLVSATFNKGKIGRWKNYFNEEHKKVFKEKYGDILIFLGYEQDYNW